MVTPSRAPNKAGDGTDVRLPVCRLGGPRFGDGSSARGSTTITRVSPIQARPATFLGFQSGDRWCGEWTPGRLNAAGVYFATPIPCRPVDGLVTNDAATGYVMRNTGRLDLNGWTGGAYWTHYGPGDWYLDAVRK